MNENNSSQCMENDAKVYPKATEICGNKDSTIREVINTEMGNKAADMSEKESRVRVELDTRIKPEICENEAGISMEINMNRIETETINVTENKVIDTEIDLRLPDITKNESCTEVEILVVINCFFTIIAMAVTWDYYYLQVHPYRMDYHIDNLLFLCNTLSVLIFIFAILICTGILQKKPIFIGVFFLFGISNVVSSMVLTIIFGEVWTFLEMVVFVTITIIMIIWDTFLGRYRNDTLKIADTEMKVKPSSQDTFFCRVSLSGQPVNEQPDGTENPTPSYPTINRNKVFTLFLFIVYFYLYFYIILNCIYLIHSYIDSYSSVM